MNLLSPKNFKEILLKHNAQPLKRLGQNFLIDKNVLKKIIDSAELKSTDTVLEVGPGIGTLTQELAKSANKVVAVEKDKKMCEILEETLRGYKNIKIVNADILKLNPTPYTLNPYKIVANIPYYLTSPLIRKFLESSNPPSEIILMVQKEVAQRICAKPPSPPTNFGKSAGKNKANPQKKLVGGKMSLLAVSVQFYAEPKIISYVSKNCFWPAPKIDSAIIKITPLGSKPGLDPNLFFKIVKAGFSHPRKQLAGNLSKSLKIKKEKVSSWLLKNNVNPSQRAETLSIEDWKNLTISFGSKPGLDPKEVK
jgi:16S rRNA (adenine1518-N6/adenine1519-N6)-dimethyltransferase